MGGLIMKYMMYCLKGESSQLDNTPPLPLL